MKIPIHFKLDSLGSIYILLILLILNIEHLLQFLTLFLS